MKWTDYVAATAEDLGLLICLMLLYRLIFRRKTQKPWAQSIIARTRIWAYVCIFFISILWITYQWSVFSGRYAGFKIMLFLTLGSLAIIIVETITALVYDYFLIQKKRASIPTIFRDLVRGGVYLFLVGLYFYGVLHIDVVPILTTSAIISIILGLALQDTLGNVFSGLALHMSNPFSIGDWIKVGEYEGKVEKIDWRSTSIMTLSSDYVVIPNSSLSKLDLQNYSSPTTRHERLVTVSAHYEHPPNIVCDALEIAALAADGVLADPPPRIHLVQYGDSSITYNLRFFIDDFSRHDDIESNVMKQIWYHFKRHGIQIPFPIMDVYHHVTEKSDLDPLDDGRVLGNIDFFKPLTSEEMTSLTKRLRHDLYPRGDVLFRQGDTGDRFYVVKSGRVEVSVARDSGEVLFSTILDKGAFFGEMSLLTGEPRSATAKIVSDAELLSLGKNDLRDLISSHSNLDEFICDAITERQKRTQSSLDKKDSCIDSEALDDDETVRRNQMLHRIRAFFSF